MSDQKSNNDDNSSFGSNIKILESIENKKNTISIAPSMALNSIQEQVETTITTTNLTTVTPVTVSEVVKLADPISPAATAVPRNEIDPPNDDDDTTKVILNLATSSQFQNEVQEEEKIIAQSQLEELDFQTGRIKKGRKPGNAENNSEINENVGTQNKPVAVKQKRGRGKKPKQLEEDTDNEDLVAIMEGENEGHYEIVAVIPERNEKKVNNEQSSSAKDSKKANDNNEKVVSTTEVKKQRGRKRKISSAEQQSSNRMAATLINSLTSDWSDDNERDLDTVSVQAVVEPKKATTTSIKKKTEDEETKTSPELNKPRRIIKKKIIWDPDAPETHFPLASLVHSSTKQKKPLQQASNKSPTLGTTVTSTTTTATTIHRSATPKNNFAPKSKVVDKPELTATTENVAGQKRQSQTPIILNNKKKKLSEMDKLLNDEGVSNMLNELENDESNSKGVGGLKKRQVVLKKATPSPTSTKRAAVLTPKKEITVTTATKRGGTPISKKQNGSPINQTTSGARKTKMSNVIDDNSIPLPKKRIPKPKKDNWDFVYNHKNIDSMIIRRRSSSYSSTTSPRRLSLEHASSPQSGTVAASSTKKEISSNKKLNTNKRGKVGISNESNFEFTKPEIQKNDGKVLSSSSTTGDGGKKITVLKVEELPRKSLRAALNEAKEQKQFFKANETNVKIKKFDNVTQLIVQTKVQEFKCSFTVQILKDLVNILKALSNDESCSVVVITSNGSYFCQGIDFTSLIYSNAEKRKNASQIMAKAVRDFLEALISFPKPLIAGIQGACSGLGVTMLPLFDIVISSDESTFETMYAKIGQIPEGYCILSLTNRVRHNFKTKLLWLCEKITSTEAALSGLVTKVKPPNQVEEDTIGCAKQVATLSLQAFRSMKSQRFKNELSKLLQALDEEEKILATHWASAECQEKFKSYIQNQQW